MQRYLQRISRIGKFRLVQTACAVMVVSTMIAYIDDITVTLHQWNSSPNRIRLRSMNITMSGMIILNYNKYSLLKGFEIWVNGNLI